MTRYREVEDDLSLRHTPTWVVAGVCIVFISISLLAERGIHHLGNWLLKKKKKPLYEALQKMKEELMLLGFISFLLTISQQPVSNICMPKSWARHLTPCNYPSRSDSGDASPGEAPPSTLQDNRNRKLLWVVASQNGLTPASLVGFKSPAADPHRRWSPRRLLAAGAGFRCPPGKVLAMSPESLHQLHMFIFVMAVVHVFYSAITMLLGLTQVRSWKKWEDMIRENNHGFTCGWVEKLARQSTFVTSRTSNPISSGAIGSWVVSFFRQFREAVTKSDYLYLRMGFIKNHNAPATFNFHKYMMRSLEDDFKMVVGISGYLWVFVIIFMVLNVHGWYAYFWMSFLPIIINMVIGTKLQHIISQLAHEVANSSSFTRVPIKPRDTLFWFNRPHLLLYLIHFVFFQNAFELGFCIWLVLTFGIHSCLLDDHGFIAIRIIMGVLAQFLCSYSTLPLYALVTQMGSSYKKAIFDDPVKNAIYGWQNKAKANVKKRQRKGFEQMTSGCSPRIDPMQTKKNCEDQEGKLHIPEDFKEIENLHESSNIGPTSKRTRTNQLELFNLRSNDGQIEPATEMMEKNLLLSSQESNIDTTVGVSQIPLTTPNEGVVLLRNPIYLEEVTNEINQAK